MRWQEEVEKHIFNAHHADKAHKGNCEEEEEEMEEAWEEVKGM